MGNTLFFGLVCGWEPDVVDAVKGCLDTVEILVGDQAKDWNTIEAYYHWSARNKLMLH
jgi:hypothetical protein